MCGVVVCGVVLVVTVTGVTDSVVFAGLLVVGKDTLSVSTWVRDGGVEAVVCAVLCKPGTNSVVVVGGSLSTATVCVLVSVYAEVAVLETLVLSETMDVCEVGAGLGVEAVTAKGTAAECVVASVVSLVGETTGGRVPMVVGHSVGVVVGAGGVVGSKMSVGLVGDVSQNRAVMA